MHITLGLLIASGLVATTHGALIELLLTVSSRRAGNSRSALQPGGLTRQTEYSGETPYSVGKQTVLIPDYKDDEGIDLGVSSYYVANIQLGTPPQNLSVAVDTASSDFWVPSSESQLAYCEYSHQEIYNRTASSSFLPGDGLFKNPSFYHGVEGLLLYDNLRIGNIKAENVSFGEAISIPRSSCDDPVQGFLGLAPSASNESTTGIAPVLQRLQDQEVLDEPVFSFHFRNLSESPRSSFDQSLLFLGGVNESYVSGNFTKLPNKTPGVWDTSMDAISFAGDQLLLENTSVTFRSGLDWLVFPSNIAAMLHAKIDASPSWFGPIVNCTQLDKLPDLELVLGGHRFSLAPRDYILEVEFVFPRYENGGAGIERVDPDDMICIVLIQGYKSDRYEFSLGMPFLQRYYSLFNLTDKTVSLAEAVH